MTQAGPDVVGVDWRTPLDVARSRIDAARRADVLVGVQGNLDPAVCLCPWPVVEAKVHEVLARQRRPPGPRLQPRPRRAARRPIPAILEQVVATVHGSPPATRR